MDLPQLLSMVPVVKDPTVSPYMKPWFLHWDGADGTESTLHDSPLTVNVALHPVKPKETTRILFESPLLLLVYLYTFHSTEDSTHLETVWT